ncbi:uncharacterized protein LOC122015465 isoform X1 [Zingiber officinale]|uniref:Uncharacterized protein n=1 Tax=Zingiber officinale TaxID=94328 RepID=A0A8J5HTD3_ZINOF|nr:uncharacterized protein LOC122015465 isoform X1 [Zingiber officinale]KAG6535226.1 hypothetical protein ZIOFF_000191 [Zingiber officinale]
MAKLFEDAEFWLPAEILGDDEFFLGNRAGDGKPAGLPAVNLRRELPFGFAASLDSPVESVTDEEENYVAGLTKQMAHYFLQDDDKEVEVEVSAGAADNSRAMSGSPQSTLCAWAASSNKGSPNGPSLVSSPPTLSPLKVRGKAENPRDMLHEAAGQVMRLRLDELGRQESLYHRGILGAHRTSPTASAPKKVDAGFLSPNPVLSQQQLQAARFYHLKRQLAIKQQLSAAAWVKQAKLKPSAGCGRYCETPYCRPLDLPASAWPPLRKPPPAQTHPPLASPGTGMRAVFLHTAGARKESAGTGVFLPRTAVHQLEPKKKTGCSTVLVPDRVVRALNLNFDEFAAQPRCSGGFVLSHEALIGRSNVVPSHHNKPHHKLSTQPPTGLAAYPASAAAVPTVHETGLPQEWTY